MSHFKLGSSWSLPHCVFVQYCFISIPFRSRVPFSGRDRLFLRRLGCGTKRLGYSSFSLLHFFFPTLVPNKRVSEISCETCELGKHHRTIFHPSINKRTIPFSLIHMEVWGPSHIPILNGYKWFLSFIDDCTHTTWVYLIKEKNAVFSHL